MNLVEPALQPNLDAARLAECNQHPRRGCRICGRGVHGCLWRAAEQARSWLDCPAVSMRAAPDRYHAICRASSLLAQVVVASLCVRKLVVRASLLQSRPTLARRRAWEGGQGSLQSTSCDLAVPPRRVLVPPTFSHKSFCSSPHIDVPPPATYVLLPAADTAV